MQRTSSRSSLEKKPNKNKRKTHLERAEEYQRQNVEVARHLLTIGADGIIARWARLVLSRAGE